MKRKVPKQFSRNGVTGAGGDCQSAEAVKRCQTVQSIAMKHPPPSEVPCPRKCFRNNYMRNSTSNIPGEENYTTVLSTEQSNHSTTDTELRFGMYSQDSDFLEDQLETLEGVIVDNLNWEVRRPSLSNLWGELLGSVEQRLPQHRPGGAEESSTVNESSASRSIEDDRGASSRLGCRSLGSDNVEENWKRQMQILRISLMLKNQLQKFALLGMLLTDVLSGEPDSPYLGCDFYLLGGDPRLTEIIELKLQQLLLIESYAKLHSGAVSSSNRVTDRSEKVTELRNNLLSVPTEYQFQPAPPNHSSLQVQNHHQPQSLPAIVVNQADHVQCGDSTTFQRLGMKRPDCNLANVARALETRALSSVQASPPEVTTPGLQALTSSLVLSGNHQVEGRRAKRVQVAEESAGRQEFSFQQSRPKPSKLQQVRMVNFPSFQTSCAKTPGNVIKTKRSSLKGTSHGQRSVSTLQPSQLFLAGHDMRSDQPLLDVREMCSTAITTGDLRDLCEDTAEGETSLSHPCKDILTVATVSPGAALTPSPGATLTPAATITPVSAPQSSHDNPSPLTSLGSYLTPSIQYILSKLQLLQQAQQPVQFETDWRSDPSPHFAIAEGEDRVNTKKQEISHQIVIAGQDARVMDRSPSSPHLIITGGGTALLPIISSDMFVTMGKEQHGNSPANASVINKNFDPAQPHRETGHCLHQHPLSDLQVGDKNQVMSPGGSLIKSSIYDRKSSYPPSKIPINEGYLNEKPGFLNRASSLFIRTTSPLEPEPDKADNPNPIASAPFEQENAVRQVSPNNEAEMSISQDLRFHVLPRQPGSTISPAISFEEIFTVSEDKRSSSLDKGNVNLIYISLLEIAKSKLYGLSR